MDPLSSVLSLLQPRRTLAAGLEAGGDWAVAFPALPGAIKTGGVASGTCWLCVADAAAPVRLAPGDVFLLPHGQAFVLASDPALPPVPASEILAGVTGGGVASVNGGHGFSLVSTRFALSGTQSGFLLGMLPHIVHIRAAAADRADLIGTLRRILSELRDPRPGGDLVIGHLAHLMLVEALRRHLTANNAGQTGWLFALGDGQMAAALQAIHAAPAARWTVDTLARRAGMSRSSFAARFRATVGLSPVGYLIRWRMAVAAERLVRGHEPVSAIAHAIGYESEAAFSTAFKRVMGLAPRRYAQARMTSAGRRADLKSEGSVPSDGSVQTDPVDMIARMTRA